MHKMVCEAPLSPICKKKKKLDIIQTVDIYSMLQASRLCNSL